ncbi:hypothetical protein NKG05_30750 [Oerskovia sp. M15]
MTPSRSLPRSLRATRSQSGWSRWSRPQPRRPRRSWAAATEAPPERPRRFTQPVVPVEQPREKMIPFTTALRDPLLEELRTYCRENRVQIVDVVNRGVELALDEAYKARDAH